MMEEAIRKLREQQSGVKERSPQWMVAQQLMDLCRAEPECAELLARDLDMPELSIVEAEPLKRKTAPEGAAWWLFL